MLFEFLAVLLVLLLLAALVPILVFVFLSLPLADALNILLRKVGLAGPFRGSRTPGVRATGTITGPFAPGPEGHEWYGTVFVKGEIWSAVCDRSLGPTLLEGERVEVVYENNLTVTVLGKTIGPGSEKSR